MSPVLVSVFILASSGFLLFYWLRLACQAILSKRFEQDYGAEVAETSALEFLAIRKALADYPEASPHEQTLCEALERDYKALTYLLRKTATVRRGQYARSELLLMLDFQLLCLWLRLKRVLELKSWCSTLLQMATILEYFANVLGQRLCSSMNVLTPCLATPDNSHWPLLRICTYCKNVQFSPSGTPAEWVTAERYHQLGGKGSVLLSHGICPPCCQNIVKPMLLRHQRGAN